MDCSTVCSVASPERSGRLKERLPRGRHGLPRETVTESQRRRIHRAMVEVVSERGYPETRVVDVIGAAGVSRRTFYEFFESKEACFLATYDGLLDKLFEEIGRAFETEPTAPWPDRAAAALETLLEKLVDHPADARFAIVEVPAAGPMALARRDAALRRFAGLLEGGFSETAVDLPDTAPLAIVGGVNELLCSEILRGETARLSGRLPDLVFWITLPFLGAEAATTERERAHLSPRRS
jgi:AcrR family transcriptional regulator